MSDIQNISIASTQTVPQPKPHTTYTIQISTSTRTWNVQRRYNDFVALHAELVSATNKEPPAALPPKHPWSLTRSAYDDKIVRERRVLLETYLRAVLTHRDPRWRQAFGWSDFLAVPTPAASSSRSDGDSTSAAPTHWTASNWLGEHGNVQTLLRSTRSELLKRDALASMGDPAGSRGASVTAKKLLRDVGDRVDGLERGLKEVMGGLGDGEKKRREEMVQGLRAERANLQRMAEAGVRTTFNRDASTTSTNTSTPGGSSLLFGANPPSTGRVFGKKAPPQETAETRPLDDRGLLQLQQTKMQGQDQQLEELSKLLQRQKGMGEEIHREIGDQTEMLEDIDGEVGRVGGKMARSKRQMNKLG